MILSSSVMAFVTRKLFSFSSSRCTLYRSCGLSLSLTRNSTTMMLNLVKRRRLVIRFVPLVSFRMGLTTTLVTRQFSIDFSFSWVETGIVIITAVRQMAVTSRNAFMSILGGLMIA